MGRFLGIVMIWAIVLGGAGLAYKHFVIGWDPAADPEAKDGGRKDKDKDGNNDVVLPKIRMAGDTFSGYCIFRSPEFKKRLEKGGFDFEWVDDNADYKARMQTIKNGDPPLAVFTIDALIAQSSGEDDPPAAIIMLIDETRGADAIISYAQGVKNVNDLNSDRAEVVLTGSTPSETLFRVMRNQFDLSNLLVSNITAKGEVVEVYKEFLRTEPTARKAFVLWEPYVSLALKEKKALGAQVLVDSSQFKGYIVDVLVVQQSYLRENGNRVDLVVKTYLDILHEQQRSQGMARMVLEDAKIIKEDKINTLEIAEQVAKGIWWKNTVENYSHLGILPSDAKGGNLQPVSDMINRITTVLNQTRPKDAPTIRVSRSDRLVNENVMRNLYGKGVHSSQTMRDDGKLVGISDADWNRLQVVANFKVKSIGFSTSFPDRLRDEAKETLAELANDLRLWPNYYLRIEGHSENKGDPVKNKELGGRRAEAVLKYLVEEQGIENHRLKAVAMEPGQGKEVRFVGLWQPASK